MNEIERFRNGTGMVYSSPIYEESQYNKKKKFNNQAFAQTNAIKATVCGASTEYRVTPDVYYACTGGGNVYLPTFPSYEENHISHEVLHIEDIKIQNDDDVFFLSNKHNNECCDRSSFVNHYTDLNWNKNDVDFSQPNEIETNIPEIPVGSLLYNKVGKFSSIIQSHNDRQHDVFKTLNSCEFIKYN